MFPGVRQQKCSASALKQTFTFEVSSEIRQLLYRKPLRRGTEEVYWWFRTTYFSVAQQQIITIR
jgi:hypothetical protein